MPKSRNRGGAKLHRSRVNLRQLRGQQEYNRKINKLKAISEMNKKAAEEAETLEQNAEVMEAETVNLEQEEEEG